MRSSRDLENDVKLERANRIALLREIGRSVILGSALLKQVAGGDFSPDPHLTRVPTV